MRATIDNGGKRDRPKNQANQVGGWSEKKEVSWCWFRKSPNWIFLENILKNIVDLTDFYFLMVEVGLNFY